MKNGISSLFILLVLMLTALLLSSCELAEYCPHIGEWNITQSSTCEEEGEKTKNCVICKAVVTEIIPPKGHTKVKDAAVEADCENYGLTEGSHCSECNKVLVAQDHVPAKGHDLTITLGKEATCLSGGISNGEYCTVCERILATQQATPALGHSYTETIITEASCVSQGSKSLICERCGDSKTESFSLGQYSANEIYELSKDAVGEIVTYDKKGNEFALGTGFVYSSDGRIITNYHVIEDAYSAKITVAGRTYTVKNVLAYDKAIDLAVLKIDASNLKTVPICKMPVQVGTSVYAIGSSRGLTETFSQGIVTHADRKLDGVVYVQHDAAISSGNSGGPLINQYGEIIGINTWTVRDSQNLNFAIFTTELDKLSYKKTLTMAQFYEAESNALEKIINMIKDKGSYEDGEYSLSLGTQTSGSITVSKRAYYDTAENCVELCVFIDAEHMLTLTIDKLDGVYEWDYYDESDYFMYGTVSASSFTSSSMLTYSGSNISNSTIKSIVVELATSMLQILCYGLDDDLSSIGVTAKDLGFNNF